MITGDNPRTASAIAREAGVDDFLAEATPEAKMLLIQEEQAKGKLVAMTGDGTNDAPALAQADVGVAMNTGTQAAKEAGNMVELDSNPTKLLEVVEVGKQLLMTRGSLTTFSIANDVAKYFAILPAMFMGLFPQIAPLNVMGLCSPQSAILSAVIFNALIIVLLIPLALRGVRYRPLGAAALLRRSMLIYGVGTALDAQRANAGEHRVTLQSQVFPGLGDVHADPERVQLVFGNLLSNAIRYSPAGSTVTVRAARADGHIRFEISDQGPGIAQQYQDAIFEKYLQLPGERSGDAGLGLFIAREIVHAHGGQLGVTSELGQGSTFWFTLPVSGA